jgi:3-dehydroquinate dehydratase type I
MQPQHGATNRIAVSLALPDTASCLETLRRLAPQVSLAELRLDMMRSFDLKRLIAESPVRLIITCRPPREGGHFRGSEAERQRVLWHAINLGCAYVDVEWDTVAEFGGRGPGGTQLIASRHWYSRMPETFWPDYETLREQAAVVKLVGLAERAADVLPVFNLMSRATTPFIALAMGAAGQLTRLLAPVFEQCLLTYGAASAGAATATGQLSVAEMIDGYQLQRVGSQTQIQLRLCADSTVAAVTSDKSKGAGGDVLQVLFGVSPQEAAEVVKGLLAYLPRLTLSADRELRNALPPDLAACLAT